MTALGKISVSSLADAAFERLVQAITSGELKPGQRLSEATLARQFGTSRGPLREALGRLEGRLVVRRPRLGVSVIELSLKSISELFVVREALEGMAARLAAQNMTEAELKDLRVALAQHAHDPAMTNGASYYPTPLAQSFHFMIVKGAKNSRLEELLFDQLRMQIWLHRFRSKESPGHAVKAWREHAEIVDALESRDPDRAEEAMRQHIRAYLTEFLSQLSANEASEPTGSERPTRSAAAGDRRQTPAPRRRTARL